MNEGNTLPSDLPRALLVGRVWRPGPVSYTHLTLPTKA